MEAVSRSAVGRRLVAMSAVLAIWASQAGADVIVQGNITTQTWERANSPYIVVANSTVLSGHTLTIKPGVVVVMGHDVELRVDGGLS